jgi:hypothetical protein
MKTQFVITTLVAALLGCGSTLAQVGGTGISPLSATSPLAIGSGSPVAPTGIPLGATEMTAPGTSPAPSTTMSCSTAGGPTSQTATPLFDGGGMAGVATSACAGTGSAGTGGAGTGGAGTAGAGLSMPTISTLQAGRAGIPLGSTEIGSAGLSPPPPVSTMFVSPIVPSTTAPLSTMGSPPSMTATPPCPVTGTFPDGSTTRQARSGSGGTTIVPGC